MITLDKKKTIAVIGASNNVDKYGYRIVRTLLDRGFKVWPINPKETKICGVRAYARLADLPRRPDIINFVVPPNITLSILEEVKELGWDNLWFQPGSFDELVIARVKELPVNYSHDDCIMVASAVA